MRGNKEGIIIGVYDGEVIGTTLRSTYRLKLGIR